MADIEPTNSEPLSAEDAQAKAAILAECEKLAAAGVTFVAVHFDGYGDSGVSEEVRCFDAEYYAYENTSRLPTTQLTCRSTSKP